MSPNGAVINSKELEFAVSCIESIAKRLDMPSERVYKALTEKSDILYGYIMPMYMVLSSLHKDEMVDDILELMEGRGITV